jgi:hypothetical protein
MSKKHYESITVYETVKGKQIAKVRMIGMRQETANFIKWIRNQKNEFFYIRPDQIKIFDAFFALGIGEGKTELSQYLNEYDAITSGRSYSSKSDGKSEQFKVFQCAYTLHKYFLKGNMRPIENFISMLVDIAKESDYEKPAMEVKALLSSIKTELDKQIEIFDLADVLNRGAEKGE